MTNRSFQRPAIVVFRVRSGLVLTGTGFNTRGVPCRQQRTLSSSQDAISRRTAPVQIICTPSIASAGLWCALFTCIVIVLGLLRLYRSCLLGSWVT